MDRLSLQYLLYVEMEIPTLDNIFDVSDPHASVLPLIPYIFPAADQAEIDLHVQPLAQGTTNGVRTSPSPLLATPRGCLRAV